MKFKFTVPPPELGAGEMKQVGGFLGGNSFKSVPVARPVKYSVILAAKPRRLRKNAQLDLPPHISQLAKACLSLSNVLRLRRH